MTACLGSSGFIVVISLGLVVLTVGVSFLCLGLVVGVDSVTAGAFGLILILVL